MQLKATLPITAMYLVLSILFIPALASTSQSDLRITPPSVSVQFDTRQLISPRPLYYAVANKAVFVSNDDASVDMFDTDTELWSTSSPNTDSRGALLAAADDYLVFNDKTDTSVLHVFTARTSSWSTANIPSGVNRYHQTVGNYVFYSIGFSYTVVVYNIATNTWIQFEEEYDFSENIIIPITYQSYAVFFFRSRRTSYLTAWNTAAELTRIRFDYGGEYRQFPSAGVAGDYLVVGGGVLETSYSADFSIRNPYTDEYYSGKMPTARYLLTFLYANPLMLFTDGNLTEAFNLETQQWLTIIDTIDISEARVSVGEKLFMTYTGQSNGVEFDSTTLKWSSFSFTDSNVGRVVKLLDVGAFINSDNIVVFHPNGQQWTKAQLSVLSNTQLKDAFVVGSRVVVVSSDDRTVYVTDYTQLTSLPTSPPTPTTPTSLPTPTSPPTPTTVPWSPWTMPVTNAPVMAPVTNSPVATSNPSSPSTQAPSNDNVPTISSPVASPASVATPVSRNNLQATSSAAIIAMTAAIVVVCLAVSLI